MNNETKFCQNCKSSFVIEQADFDFYKKINVPPPTFCPDCRLQRRYAYRIERTLYKAHCGICKKNIFSAYPDGGTDLILCQECYISDKWDPMSYGKEYDFSRPFFEQFDELMKVIPKRSLWQMNSVNCDYSNFAKDTKNLYLCFSMVGSEDCAYCKNVDKSRLLYDSLNAAQSERGFWNIYATQNYDVNYSVFTRSCINSWFLFDCVTCQNCFMSANLRNAEYVFYGKQLTKQQYAAEMTKINTGSYKKFQELVTDFNHLYANALHKYSNIVKAVHSTGHILANVKNAQYCFEVFDSEDVAYCGRAFILKDCMDTNNIANAELMYEYTSGGDADRNVKFSFASNGATSDCMYTGWCANSSNLFGCLSVRDKQYCILNKQYSKEEYVALVSKIIKHMNDIPYKGGDGRVYGYGEFPPFEISIFPYNDSVAQEYFPLSKEQIVQRGYKYREPADKNPKIDIGPSMLPDDIDAAGDDILQKIIGCEHCGVCLHQCTRAFRMTAPEFEMYKRIKLPLPRQCPNCRHYDRLKFRNPWKLWYRKCMCDRAHSYHQGGICQKEFKTSYAPDRPEKIYCEPCYNAEVV